MLAGRRHLSPSPPLHANGLYTVDSQCLVFKYTLLFFFLDKHDQTYFVMLPRPSSTMLHFKPCHSQFHTQRKLSETQITHIDHYPFAQRKMTFSAVLLCVKHVLKITICLLLLVTTGFSRLCAYAAAVVSRVLSYQLTYFPCSQALGPVYKPLPAEDVEYGAWKIDRHSLRLAINTNEKKRNCSCAFDKLGLPLPQTAHRRLITARY